MQIFNLSLARRDEIEGGVELGQIARADHDVEFAGAVMREAELQGDPAGAPVRFWETLAPADDDG